MQHFAYIVGRRCVTAALIAVFILAPLGAYAQTTDIAALIAQLQAQISALQAQINALQTRQLAPPIFSPEEPLPSSSPTLRAAACPNIIARALYLGLRGPDVSELQQFLRERGYFTYPTNTGYFGPLTEQAVQEFQKSQEIVSSGDPETTGFGVVGRLTRSTIARRCSATHQTSVRPELLSTSLQTLVPSETSNSQTLTTSQLLASTTQTSAYSARMASTSQILSPTSGVATTYATTTQSDTTSTLYTQPTTTTQTQAFVVTLTVSLSDAVLGYVSGPGIFCGTTLYSSGTDCAETYSIATSTPNVTLSAFADTASSTFGGWAGCDSVNGANCTITMSTSKSVTARFVSVSTDTPDLAPIGVGYSAPQGFMEGKPIYFNSTIENKGVAGTIASSTAAFKIDLNNDGVYDIVLEEVQMGPMRSGSAYGGSFAQIITTSAWIAKGGLIKVTACADIYNVVTETNEENNCNSRQYTVASAVSAITIINVNLSTSILQVAPSTNNVPYSITIHNSSSGAVSGIDIQTYIEQGSVRKSAGWGGKISCGLASGDIPGGVSCTTDSLISAVSDSLGGVFISGDAKAIFHVRKDFNSVAQLEVPVVLISPFTSASVSATLDVSLLGSGRGAVQEMLTWDINCGWGISGSPLSKCTKTYEFTPVTRTLTATPSATSTFVGWTGCDSVNGTQCVVTISSDKTVTAQFGASSTDKDLSIYFISGPRLETAPNSFAVYVVWTFQTSTSFVAFPPPDALLQVTSNNTTRSYSIIDGQSIAGGDVFVSAPYADFGITANGSYVVSAAIDSDNRFDERYENNNTKTATIEIFSFPVSTGATTSSAVSQRFMANTLNAIQSLLEQIQNILDNW